MKMQRTLILGLVLLEAAICSAYAAPLRPLRQQRPANIPQGLRPNAGLRTNQPVRPAIARTLVQNDVYAFYVKQFQQDGEVTPDTLAKILPFLNQFLQDRFEIAERRTRALQQLRQTFARNGTDDEFIRLSRELDQADAEFLANHEKFLHNVDPLLSPRMQARVRILQNQADNRIRQVLDALQNANAQQRRAQEEE
jgi:hypothetical protein